MNAELTDWPVILPVVLMVFLQIADVMTTVKILGSGGVELNPVMAWMMRHGSLWILVKMAAAVGLTWYFFANPFLWVLVAMQAAVVVWNYRSL